jgi:hypothetical protein
MGLEEYRDASQVEYRKRVPWPNEERWRTKLFEFVKHSSLLDCPMNINDGVMTVFEAIDALYTPRSETNRLTLSQPFENDIVEHFSQIYGLTSEERDPPLTQYPLVYFYSTHQTVF